MPASEAVRGAILALCVGGGFVVVRLFARKIAELPAFGKQLAHEEMERPEDIGR